MRQRVRRAIERSAGVRAKAAAVRERTTSLWPAEVWTGPPPRSLDDAEGRRAPVELLLPDGSPSERSRWLVERAREIARTTARLREARERERERERVAFGRSSVFLEILERMPDAVLITDDVGRIELTNEAAARLLDREQRFLMGKPLPPLIDGFDVRLRLRTLLAARGKHDPADASYALRLRNGRTCVATWVRFPAGAWGKHARIVWILHDVTDLLAAEAALRERDARLQSVFQGALDAIAVNLLEDGIYLDVNPRFEKLTGFSREEALGRTPQELGVWTDREQRDEVLRRLRDDGTIPKLDVRLRRKDGAEVIGLCSATTATVEGRPVVISYFRDVTAERRTESELRDLEARMQSRSRMAELGAVVARVVHDLRNPLLAITLNAGAILREVGEANETPLAELAADVVAGARRLEQLLAGIAAFTRHKEPRLEDTDAVALTRQVRAILAPLARERRVTLSVHAGAAAPLRADAPQILRVLENLVRNAIDALGNEAGTVRIEYAALAPGQVRLTVRDDGPGIPEGFDPFALFATTKPDGTGLGLAIAREIAESHGGTLTLERLAPRGTAFHLDLPTQPRPAAAERLPSPHDRH